MGSFKYYLYLMIQIYILRYVEQNKVVVKLKLTSSNNNNILRSNREENNKHNQTNKDKRAILEKTNTQIFVYPVRTNMSYNVNGKVNNSLIYYESK